jgi:uncharacterized protein
VSRGERVARGSDGSSSGIADRDRQRSQRRQTVTVTDTAGTPTSFRPAEFEVLADGSGRLLGSKCRQCGAHFFPIREACSGCLGTDLETVRFSTVGTLYTFSVVRQSTPAFQVPYVLGYVDLPEGVRIMAQISGCEPEDARIGMDLELAVEEFGVEEDGSPLLGYRFRPMRGEGTR